jgi:S1-C subfamily serine protease
VVLQVADRPVITRDAARDALADMSPDRVLPLVIRRGAEQVHLSLTPSPNPAVSQ